MPKIPETPMPVPIFGQMQDDIDMVGMNPIPLEKLIKSRGMRMVHQKPLPCPNQKTLNGGDHDPNCSMCYNGFVYYDKKEFIGAMSGNGLNRQFQMGGTFDIDQVSMTVPSKDSFGNELDFQFFDQILVLDVFVRVFQRVQSSQIGVDRLHFAAETIDKVMGSDGSEYIVGIGCIVENGMVKWISSNRPGYDLNLALGDIYSINYYTKPTFTIVGMPHHLRVTQSKDKDGNSVQTRYPQLITCRRDFIPHQNNDMVGRKDAGEPNDGGAF